MLPRWHIVFGAFFAFVIWLVAPETNKIYLLLVFLSSFLIDTDHYLVAVFRTKKLSFKNSLNYFKILGKMETKERKQKIKRKGPLYVFHTLEFHLFILFLGIIWTGFFYIFLGMIFHSLLDVVWMIKNDRIYRREYFLLRGSGFIKIIKFITSSFSKS